MRIVVSPVPVYFKMADEAALAKEMPIVPSVDVVGAPKFPGIPGPQFPILETETVAALELGAEMVVAPVQVFAPVSKMVELVVVLEVNVTLFPLPFAIVAFTVSSPDGAMVFPVALSRIIFPPPVPLMVPPAPSMIVAPDSFKAVALPLTCLLYTSPSPRD